MARRLLLVALGAAAVSYVFSASRRRLSAGDPAANGGSREPSDRVRRLVGEVRRRIEADAGA